MNYWQKRQQQLNKQLEKDEEKLKKRLSSFYDSEFRKLEKEIAAYYQKYGEENVIQYRKLMEELPEEDKRLLLEQMDVFADKYPQYEYLLPIRKSIYKLNRLEGLQYSIRMQQLEIGAANIAEISKHLERNAMRGVNAAAESLGFGKNFYSNNRDITKLFVNVPWTDGKNFSERIWGNTEKLSNYLNTDIAQAIARGDSYDRIIQQLRTRFDTVTRRDAYRLIYTEGTYVMAEATMQPFIEDFEKYRLSTVGDGKVCSICRGVAGGVFDIKNRCPGVNFPPLHPWCRCSFTIEVDNWDAWMEEYEKRHGNGQSEKIANRVHSDIINSLDKKEDIEVHSVGKINRDIYKCITEGIVTDEVIITDERIEHIKERHPNDYERFYTYIPEIIANPDFIVAANKPNTAVILKEVRERGEKFKLVLRIKVQGDPEEYKNSIMTFWHIGEKTWRKTLKNKTVLYKKE